MGGRQRTDHSSRYDLVIAELTIIPVLTISGPLRIYRVPGSVAFLNSGTTLHAILPKSQCWCVDGECKFVLRIRRNSYYRIELPYASAEEKTKAEELKKVLCKILQYELTPCPFQRGFTIDLPESSSTPIKKRPWQPRQRSSTLSDFQEHGRECSEASDAMQSDRGDTEDAEKSRQEIQSIDPVTPKPIIKQGSPDFDTLETPTRPKALAGARAITAPPQLILKSNPPFQPERTEHLPDEAESDAASIASSMDSFHSFRSFHSPTSPLPLSPPYSDPPSPSQRTEEDIPDINVHRIRQHTRDLSELTVTAEISREWDLMDTPRAPKEATPSSPITLYTPSLTNDAASQSDENWPEIKTPSPQTRLRSRAKSSRRRTPSPLPPPANLYSPRSQMSGHHLTAAILQRTCSLLMGPPAQLVALMLQIARRITNGTLYGLSIGYGDQNHKLPGTWDSGSEIEDDSEDYWEEDDYGISLGVIPGSRSKGAVDIGGSWEID